MKVLESKPWALRIKCPHCKSLLEAYANDVKAGNYAVGYAGETDEWEPYLECASCKGEIRLKESRVPGHIWQKALDLARRRSANDPL